MMRERLSALGFALTEVGPGGDLWSAPGKDGTSVSVYCELQEGYVQVVQAFADPDDRASVVTWNHPCNELFTLLEGWVE